MITIEILIKAFLLLFIPMDVLGNIPVFNILMEKMNPENRRHTIHLTVLIAFALLLVFLFGGIHILNFFNISIKDFMVAGGIILMIMGIKLVLGLGIREKRADQYETAIVPMATPLITGPAVITAIIISVDLYGYAASFISAVLNIIIAFAGLRLTPVIFRFLGRQGGDVVSKIFGIILVAMAISFIRGGI